MECRTIAWNRINTVIIIGVAAGFKGKRCACNEFEWQTPNYTFNVQSMLNANAPQCAHDNYMLQHGNILRPDGHKCKRDRIFPNNQLNALKFHWKFTIIWADKHFVCNELSVQRSDDTQRSEQIFLANLRCTFHFNAVLRRNLVLAYTQSALLQLVMIYCTFWCTPKITDKTVFVA